MSTTTIAVDYETKEQLKKYKKDEETWKEALERLVNLAEKVRALEDEDPSFITGGRYKEVNFDWKLDIEDAKELEKYGVYIDWRKDVK